MDYIILDMEWNQPWPGSYAAKKVLPVQIHGEIIQIGLLRQKSRSLCKFGGKLFKLALSGSWRTRRWLMNFRS